MRSAVKRILQYAVLVVLIIPALFCGFGRFQQPFTFFAEALALLPGLPGSALRAAFYRLTLARCSQDVRLGLGTYIGDPSAELGDNVSIGSYCVIGRAIIGERTQIGSGVQITSGRRQHERDASGALSSTVRQTTRIGRACWIGSSSVVMADVGEGTTVGAGAVVVKPLDSFVIAVGNPARVIRQAESA